MPLTPAQDTLGESPIVLGDGSVSWVDSLQKKVHALRDGDVQSRGVSSVLGSIAPTSAGQFVAALENTVVLLEEDAEEVLCSLDLPPRHRLNDGAAGPSGEFVFGSMNEDRTAGTGALYRLNRDGLTILRSDVVLSNGIDWSPDGGRIYYTDSARGIIYTAEYDPSGPLADESIFTIWDGPGMPDGLVVDADGFVWVAIWGGAHLARLSPEGEIVRTIAVPVPLPTSLTFGGAHLDTLYITSARVSLSDAELARHPLSGALFAAHLGIARGRTQHQVDSAAIQKGLG